MNYIITKNKSWFEKIGSYNYCDLDKLKDLPKIIGFDTETTGLEARHNEVFCAQIGTGTDNFIIDMQNIGDDRYTFKDIIPYLADKSLVGHNLTFDLGFCYKYGFYPKDTYDTMIGSKLLHNGKPTIRRHDFGSVMERELGLIYDKSDQKNIHKIQLSTQRSIQYSFNDVDRILDLVKDLVDKLRKEGTIQSFSLHCKYIQALAYMEQCGLPLSKKAWKLKMMRDEVLMGEKANVVSDYIYDYLPKYRDNQLDLFSTTRSLKLNLSSPKQMIQIFTDFGINCVDSEGKFSTETSVINKSDHPFVKLWLDFQGIKHDVTTYGENIFKRIENDRIYTSFNPILDTARISTRKEGINILNFPANEKTRECIQASPGFKLLVSDYEGQENAVGADKHQDETMVKSLQDGLDLHCAFARMIFPELKDVPDPELMKKHKDKRNYSKSPRFLFSYGGGSYTLSQNNNIPLEEAERLEALYKVLHKGIYAWGDKVFLEAAEKGYIESADGFKLYLPYWDEFKDLHTWIQGLSREFWTDYSRGKHIFKEKLDKVDPQDKRVYKVYMDNRSLVSKYFKAKAKYYKLCLNNPIQSTAAHQTKRAAWMLFDYIRSNNHIGRARIVNIPHDEFVLEVEDSLVEEYKKVLERCMIEGGNYYLENSIVYMKAEANEGLTWYEAK